MEELNSPTENEIDENHQGDKVELGFFQGNPDLPIQDEISNETNVIPEDVNLDDQCSAPRDISDTTEITETDKDTKIHPGYDKCTVQHNQETSEIVKRLEIKRPNIQISGISKNYLYAAQVFAMEPEISVVDETKKNNIDHNYCAIDKADR